MAGRSFEFAFALAASINSSFNSSFTVATQKVNNLKASFDMYDFDFELSNKEVALMVIAVFVFMVVVFSAGYFVGLHSGSTDGDGGSGGAEQVGQHIQSAVTSQREITERIDGLQNSSDKISGRIEAGAAGIEAAAAANSNAESLVRESGELIAEGQRILQTIRRRAKKDSAPH